MVQIVWREGIIPAHAGSTQLQRERVKSLEDHPRSCGEHHGDNAIAGEAVGSSPLVRGAPKSEFFLKSPIGIIPARAGSTSKMAQQLRASGDHPRSCGEHLPSVTQPFEPTGSSPLVRGALKRGHFKAI